MNSTSGPGSFPIATTAERPRAGNRLAALLMLSLIALSLAHRSANAQGVKPWVPPEADSLVRWSTEAKAAFRTNQGDSIGGANFRAYTQVGLMGRKLLRSLGRSGLLQAHAVEAVIDSFGLDTEIALDPESPTFVLLMVRNPYQRSANAVGFLYWYRQDDLRVQGLMFRGGMKPRMRVWWTADRQHPYEWAIVDESRSERRMFFKLLKLSPEGTFWDLAQFDENGPDLGAQGEATFADLDGDRRPEVVSWTPLPSDSLFEECAGCPGLIGERTFVERPEGFELNDSRLVPSPYATFTLFIRLLQANDRRGAVRLLHDPAQFDAAVMAGWASARVGKVWKLEGAEGDLRWPRWLALRFRGPNGVEHYVVHFEQREGRWIIRKWLSERTPAGTPRSGATAPQRTPAPLAPKSGTRP